MVVVVVGLDLVVVAAAVIALDLVVAEFLAGLVVLDCVTTAIVRIGLPTMTISLSLSSSSFRSCKDLDLPPPAGFGLSFVVVETGCDFWDVVDLGKGVAVFLVAEVVVVVVVVAVFVTLLLLSVALPFALGLKTLSTTRSESDPSLSSDDDELLEPDELLSPEDELLELDDDDDVVVVREIVSLNCCFAGGVVLGWV